MVEGPGLAPRFESVCLGDLGALWIGSLVWGLQGF